MRVRLVSDTIEPAIYPIAEAMKLAKDANLDLVEIAPNADPPVCIKSFCMSTAKNKRK